MSRNIQKQIQEVFRKQNKGKKIDSSFGADGNLNKSPKNYNSVARKSESGGTS